MAGGADVNLGIDIEKKGSGDKEAAAGLELVAKAADDAKDELAQLDRKLIETRAAMVAAGKDFAKTGDISPFKSLLKDERQLQQVSKTLKRLTEDVAKDVVKVGEDAGEGFLSGFGKTVSSHPVIAGAIAGGILIGLPVIAGALEAAVAGGGIAAGILLASKDSRTRAAWAQFGQRAGDELTGAASPFVGVLTRGADTFGQSFEKILPSIRRDFADLAPVADRLFVGAAGFVEKLMPGIDALVHEGGPVLDMLSRELPRLGSAISTAFSSIASAGQGGKEALQDILRMAEGTIVVFGKLTEITERVYLAERAIVQQLFARDSKGAVDSMAAALTTTKNASVGVGDAIRGAITAVTQFGTVTRGTSPALGELAKQLGQTKVTADSLAGAMTDKLLGSMLGIDQATLGFAQSQTQLSDAIKQNGTQLDIHTAKGQALRQAVLGVVAANKGEYDSMLAAGSSATEAAKAYDANTASLDAQLRKAGLTKDQVDQLIGKYRGVPANVDTTIATHGLQEAINSLDDAIRLANHLDGRVSVITIEERHRITYDAGTPPSAFFRGLATGGIIGGAASGVIANRPFIIGERTLPEAAIPAPNSGISQARADMLLGTAASWWGRRLVPAGRGGGMTIDLTVNAGAGADGTAIGRQIAKVLRTDPGIAATIKAALA